MPTYFFGGAFDPVTKAHMRIIRNLLTGRGATSLVIGVTDHDYKETPLYSLPYRITLLQLALNTELTPDLLSRVTVLVQDMRTYDYLKQLPDELRPSTICIGADELWQLAEGKWEHARELTQTYDILAIHRDDDISSTRAKDVLEMFRDAKACHEPGVDSVVDEIRRDLTQLIPEAVLSFLLKKNTVFVPYPECEQINNKEN